MDFGRSAALLGFVILGFGGGSSPASSAEIRKTVDRKFPVGKYCPLESRVAASADLSFVAPAATIRVTFSAQNLSPDEQWNALRLDNVSVVAKSVFDANLVAPVPGFDDCYNPSPPPGQTSGGLPDVPAYDFNVAGTPEALLDLFPADTAGWSGDHLYFDAVTRAPTDPATGTGLTGGALGLGQPADGDVVVRASKVVTGLAPGQTYVVFAWWYTLETLPLEIAIGVPCADLDGDGYVTCDACDLAPGETCGDCDDSNPRCRTNCADGDADGWCVTTDCDDASATCTVDCATDADLDGVADCRDGCLDEDGDGYGTAGGGGDSCLGPDCAPLERWCNESCVDGDGDGRCLPQDCDDSEPAVGNDLAEINDCLDAQCPGDAGYGVIDEISGLSGFLTPGDKTRFSWPHQTGATSYLAVRATSPEFPPGCASWPTTGDDFWVDTAIPAPGETFHYLVRALTGCKGSFGQRSSGVERAPVCGVETACANGVDDDADAAIDCADPDCAGTADCRVETFAFVDTTGDDIADEAVWQFFQNLAAGPTDYLFFEIVESPSRSVAWCSENAAYYRQQYLALAPTAGTITSGSWNKWRRGPSTGNAWQGPVTTGQLNTYGDDSGFGAYVWCSEQFSPEPQNCLFPNRIADCEVYDQASGGCGASTGETWQMTLRVASTRSAACGF